MKVLEGKSVVLLVGPTGAGKSTIANALVGGDNLVYDMEEDAFVVKE